MRPVTEFPESALRNIDFVLTDIDDTITDDGRLTAKAYSALEALQAVGIKLIPVTGRPAGWCDHFARMWPIDGVIGENGALYFRYDHEARRMTQCFWKSEQERVDDRRKLKELQKKILTEVPGAGIASDQLYRVADLAIDFCEDVPPLPAATVAKIVTLFEAAGAQAKVSSIHVNGWFGDYDKLAMARRFFADQYHLDLADITVQARIVFCGDSPNDAPMFEFFKNSVGVANVRRFIGALAAEPTYVTDQPGGAGFAELASRLIRAKAS